MGRTGRRALAQVTADHCRRLAAQGQSSRTIARRLALSSQTVQAILRRPPHTREGLDGAPYQACGPAVYLAAIRDLVRRERLQPAAGMPHHQSAKRRNAARPYRPRPHGKPGTRPRRQLRADVNPAADLDAIRNHQSP